VPELLKKPWQANIVSTCSCLGTTTVFLYIDIRGIQA